ncbi:MAG: hypothetical protein OMM_09761 [Candidatus Magnetoglobus multicellularis str. Araruama]|uniref:Uncharacterized protein n=1 Tax=Candidatus Magnetoglobus multicellularis str. Araruama TaxID=890399 RepID=A0A1V1P388_9BACT|nr:MAG: hypothetical protein OMM_09761 [Candidatus Magnetoglobus multicellularis str. Araruama]
MLPISAISGEILLDEFNDSSVGNTNGISYVDTPNGRGAVFQCAKESRIQYGFNTQIPKQGTLEFLLKLIVVIIIPTIP